MSNEGTVYIVDDEPELTATLASLVKSVGLKAQTFGTAKAFLEVYKGGSPGCLVTDLRMPGMSGTDLQQLLIDRGDRIPVIVVSGFADVPTTVRAMKAGARDVFEKGGSQHALLEAIQKAVAASVQVWEEGVQAAAIQERFNALTARERDVLELIVEGLPNREIAASLGISSKTVEVHRGRVMQKLEVDSVADLVKLALSLKTV